MRCHSCVTFSSQCTGCLFDVAVLPNSSSNSHKSESSVSVSTLVSKIGIMIAFVLSLVLENVEKPYGGWRWVIAAQYLR